MKRRPALIGLALLMIPILSGAARPTRAADAMPKVGAAAPDFSLKGEDGKSYSLRSLRGRWTVLAFYPMDFTGG